MQTVVMLLGEFRTILSMLRYLHRHTSATRLTNVALPRTFLRKNPQQPLARKIMWNRGCLRTFVVFMSLRLPHYAVSSATKAPQSRTLRVFRKLKCTGTGTKLDEDISKNTLLHEVPKGTNSCSLCLKSTTFPNVPRFRRLKCAGVPLEQPDSAPAGQFSQMSSANHASFRTNIVEENTLLCQVCQKTTTKPNISRFRKLACAGTLQQSSSTGAYNFSI